jgi:hypothetical protein
MNQTAKASEGGDDDLLSDDKHLDSSYPGLRQAIGENLVKTSLEIGCGSRATYRAIAKMTTSLYLGFNLEEVWLTRMKEYYEKRKSTDGFPLSHFLAKEILNLEERGNVVFDLVCMNSLRSHMLPDEEDGMTELVHKLLRIGRRVVIQVILAEEFGQPAVHTLTERYPFLPRLRGLPAITFYPLLWYQGLAIRAKRKVKTYPGVTIERYGVSYQTTYLLFECH